VRDSFNDRIAELYKEIEAHEARGTHMRRDAVERRIDELRSLSAKVDLFAGALDAAAKKQADTAAQVKARMERLQDEFVKALAAKETVRAPMATDDAFQI
jgi:hypothetical protein